MYFRALFLAVGSSAVFGSMAFSDPPNGTQPPQMANRVFVPAGGYTRTNKVSLLQRRAAASGAITSSLVNPCLQGTRSVLVITLAFKNRSAPWNADQLRTHLFGDPNAPFKPGEPQLTITQYYKDISDGRLNLVGRVLGPYTLPKNDDYYENNDLTMNPPLLTNGSGKPFGELLEFALREADKVIDFGEFDNDGPDGIPNSGDDDGKVDAVFIVQPEAGAECGGDAKYNIWSHQWHYSDPAYGHKGPFVSRAIRKDKSGQPILDSDGSPQHIIVDDYTIEPAIACPTPNAANQPSLIQVGVFCHEFGHLLGLPDLYGRTPSRTEGIGNWCLLAGGSFGGDGKHPDCPASMSAWCKLFLGWADVQQIRSDGLLNLEPVEHHNRMYRLDVPNTRGKEYFLIEYRDRDWKDTVYMVKFNWDKYLPGGGLAIWHIDENVGSDSPDWPFAPIDKGQNDWPSLPNSSSHSLVSLIQADRKLTLEHYGPKPWNRGVAEHLWRDGLSFQDDPIFLAGSRAYDKSETKITLQNINLAAKRAMVQASAALLAAGPQRVSGQERPDSSRLSGSKIEEILPGAGRGSARGDGGFLDELNKKLASEGAKGISLGDRQRLSTIPDERILDVISPEFVPQVRSESSKGRLRSLDKDAQVTGPAADGLKTLLQENVGTKPISVLFNPSQRIENITDLSLPRRLPTPKEDADSLLNRIPSIFGSGVTFQINEPAEKSPAASSWRYEQTFTVDGKKLPVFGTETVVYYGGPENRLKAMTSKSVEPSSIRVTSDGTNFSAEDARSLVRQKLGLTENKVRAAREGIFRVGDDPKRSRVAFEVPVAAGEKQQDIHVYLDKETKEILHIK